jgi:hypothetical protein
VGCGWADLAVAADARAWGAALAAPPVNAGAGAGPGGGAGPTVWLPCAAAAASMSAPSDASSTGDATVAAAFWGRAWGVRAGAAVRPDRSDRRPAELELDTATDGPVASGGEGEPVAALEGWMGMGGPEIGWPGRVAGSARSPPEEPGGVFKPGADVARGWTAGVDDARPCPLRAGLPDGARAAAGEALMLEVWSEGCRAGVAASDCGCATATSVPASGAGGCRTGSGRPAGAAGVPVVGAEDRDAAGGEPPGWLGPAPAAPALAGATGPGFTASGLTVWASLAASCRAAVKARSSPPGSERAPAGDVADDARAVDRLMAGAGGIAAERSNRHASLG